MVSLTAVDLLLLLYRSHWWWQRCEIALDWFAGSM